VFVRTILALPTTAGDAMNRALRRLVGSVWKLPPGRITVAASSWLKKQIRPPA